MDKMLNSIGEEDRNGTESCSMEEENDEVYEVERVIDIRWLKESDDKFEYRVRWKNYKPSEDTWEPPEHFEEESFVLRDFNEKYKQMREEKSSYLHERGKAVTPKSTRHVNILSNEIEQILKMTTLKLEPSHVVVYHVKWLGYKKSDASWESEEELLHAKDKIDLFLQKERRALKNGKRQGGRGKKLQDFDIPGNLRRQFERDYSIAIELGNTGAAGNDLYSLIKDRRSNKKAKKNDGGGSILAGLIPYDLDLVEKAREEELNRTLILSKTEFCDASEKGDYDTIYASMNSEKIPDVDFTSLFLKAARRGQRDLALLLSTHVPNLSAEDDCGDTAFTMAAEVGDVCFAHYLLVLDVPIGECNRRGQTAKEIAVKFGQKHFVKFLRAYEEGKL